VDLRTLGAVLALTAVCLLVVLIVLWRQNRQYAGLGWWALGQAFMVITFVIAAVATAGSWVLLVVLTTSSTVISLVFMYVGIVRFLGRPVPRIWPWGYLGVTVAAMAWWTLAVPSVGLRRVSMYLLLAGIQTLTVRALIVYRQDYMTTSGRFLKVVFGIAAPFYAGLAGLTLMSLRPDARTMDLGTVGVLAFFGAVTLMIMWTYGLSLLVSEHLRYDLAEDRAALHQIFLASPDSTVISRLDDGLVRDVNEGFSRLLGYARHQAVGRTAAALGLWRDPEDRRRLQQSLRAGPVDEFQTTLMGRDGPVDVAMSARVLSLGGEPYVITISRDITDRKRLEAELRRQATTDDLTGVLNRRAFMSLAEQRLAACRREGREVALAVIDLDEFKQLNDTFGHAAGDAAVRAFALGTSALLEDGDALGRLGGDEFGVLLPATSLADGHTLVERLRVALSSRPLRIGDQIVPLAFSAGVATDEGCACLDELIAKADQGLYRAKEQGRNRVVAA
jgi:diguanylate cyclase (GGDEF)-like protein/PAS domain S-box-containing protein